MHTSIIRQSLTKVTLYSSFATCLKQHDIPHRCFYSTETYLNELHSKPKRARTQSRSSKRQHDTTTSLAPLSNLLDGTKVETYLASLSDQATVTISDAERHRPQKYAPPGSRQYEEDYNNLLGNLCQSFSSKQLRQLCKEYGLESKWTRSGRLKPEYAIAIIERQWGWPSLKELEYRKALWSTYAEKSFFVTPKELFFIIGQDGGELLTLASQHKVHISLSSNPLQLKVEGVQGELDQLSDHIHKLRSDIIDEEFKLPTSCALPQNLIQRVSRLAGAYVQNIGTEGNLQVCGKNIRALNMAKRLAVRAACETSFPPNPLLTYTPAIVPSASPIPVSLFPKTYSIYPFTSSRALPWTSTASSTFRLRKVGEWLSDEPLENTNKTGGLSSEQGKIVFVNEEPANIRHILTDNFPKAIEARTRSITASLGHVLIASDSAQRASLIPPLQGQWPLPKILNFFKVQEPKTIFVPSAPLNFIKSTPSEQRILHRLVYRILPSNEKTGLSPIRIIKWEIPLLTSEITASENVNQDDISKDAPLQAAENPDGFSARSSHDLPQCSQNFVTTPANPINDEHNHSQDIANSSLKTPSPPSSPIRDSSTSPPAETPQLKPPQCLIGEEFETDLMMPDRPMDVHLSAFDSLPLPVDLQPIELQSYLSKLRIFLSYQDTDAAQPEPPLMVNYEGQSYVLWSSSSVRQSVETLIIGDTEIPVANESILDLENTHKTTLCQVTCSNPSNDQDWRLFLRSCDQLSSQRNSRKP